MQNVKRLFLGLLLLLGFSIIAFAQNDATTESTLPAPTGSYQIGRTTQHWIDTSRDEPNTDEEDYREIQVSIWYPADIDPNTAPSAYFDILEGGREGEAAKAWGVNRIPELFDWASHAYTDAAISDAEANYPVLIFSPGYTAIAEQYTVQIEELVSHGYIVLSINHPYTSGVTILSDGSVVTAKPPNCSIGSSTKAADIIFALDELEKLNSNDSENMFFSRLDLEKIGALGHSGGAGAVIKASAVDERIQAVISEDAAMVESASLRQASMYFTTSLSYWPAPEPNYIVWSTQFEHLSFMDIPIWPGPKQPLTGSIEGTRTLEIVRAYVLSFFDKYLKSKEMTLLDGESDDYPEIEFRFSDGTETDSDIPAQNGGVLIDDFESGTLDGWTVENGGSGNWYIYEKGTIPPNPSETDLCDQFNVPNPPQGQYAVVTDNNFTGATVRGSRHILYRDIELDAAYTLHMTIFYVSTGAGLFSPDSFSYLGKPNEQYRIDLLDPLAESDTLESDEIFATIYQTQTGDARYLEPTGINFDLSAWVGQTVRLRLAQVENQGGPFHVGVDNIWLEPME